MKVPEERHEKIPNYHPKGIQFHIFDRFQ